MKNILIITNIPNPYRIALFNALDSELKKSHNSLFVVFGAVTYKRRKWNIDLSECKFDYKVLKSRKITLFSKERVMFFYSGLYDLLFKLHSEAIIVTGFSVATVKLWLLSFIQNIKYIIWSGSINTKGRSDSRLREIYRRTLIKRASSFIAYGSLAKDYLIKLGAKPEKVCISINTTDINFYLEAVSEEKKIKVNSDKKDHFLYIGHLTKHKRVDLLIKIMVELKKIRDNFILDIVGDGPEKNNLLALTNKLGLKNYIYFHGFKQKNEIPYYLAKSKIFLFPSEYDIWGLVLIEAMAGGLVCISSIYAGGTTDLVIENETGFKVDFNSVSEVLTKIEYLLSHPEEIKRIGDNAKNFIQQNASIKKSATGFLTALDLK